jgi:uncharacterized protein YfkK (UPF0435 family)
MEYKKDIINYEGHIDRNVVDNILHELKTKLKILDIEVLSRKRIYSASVECLDNIYKHSEIKTNQDNANEQYLPHFSVRKTDDYYSIRASNVVLNHDVKGLKSRLEKLNQLEPAGVNSLYKDTIMKSAGLSDKGGAGLGLIVIAKTTKKQLFYDFEPINNKYSYFTLKVNIF